MFKLSLLVGFGGRTGDHVGFVMLQLLFLNPYFQVKVMRTSEDSPLQRVCVLNTGCTSMVMGWCVLGKWRWRPLSLESIHQYQQPLTVWRWALCNRYLSCGMRKPFLYAKTKEQISCMVTAQLIRAFVFAT